MRRIDLRTAVIVLILANLPTWIIIFFTVDQAKTAIDEEVAANFRAITENNAATMGYAVNNLAREVGTLAANSAVRDAILSGNASYPRSPRGCASKNHSYRANVVGTSRRSYGATDSLQPCLPIPETLRDYQSGLSSHHRHRSIRRNGGGQRQTHRL